MIKILIHVPNEYDDNWYGAEHIYRYAFVCGMQKRPHRKLGELTEDFFDINYVNGYIHGLEYHSQWKLKQLLRGNYYENNIY